MKKVSLGCLRNWGTVTLFIKLKLEYNLVCLMGNILLFNQFSTANQVFVFDR